MLPEDLQLKKIRRDPKAEKIELVLSADLNEGELTGKYETKAHPHPHFVVAIGRLRGPFIEICELKGAAEPDDIDVRTLSFSEDDNGRRGVIITAVRTLKSGATMTLNTPLKMMDPAETSDASPEEDKRLLPDRTIGLIEAVLEEARAFLDGTKRGQMEMELGDRSGNGSQPEGSGEDRELVGAGAGSVDDLLPG